MPYLDILLIINQDRTLSFDWYIKPSASNRILNYQSNHPSHQLENCAENLLFRSVSCSAKFRHKNIIIAKDILKRNGYPDKLINKKIMKVLAIIRSKNLAPPTISTTTINNISTDNDNNNIMNIDNNQQNVDQNVNVNKNIQKFIFKSLPYINNTTNRISKVIRKNVDKVKISSKPINSLGSTVFSKLKDKIHMNDTTNCVYKIPCGDCSKVYIGHTKNQLKKRISQHINDIKNVKPNGNTAIVKHLEKDGHFPKFDDVSVVCKESSLTKRLLFESFNIYCNNTINERRDIENISLIYCALLDNVGNT